MSDLKKQTFVGIIWNFAQQLAKRGLSIIITIFLARFLVPDDFGLIAMMAVFLGLASRLMESGFKEALIQKQDANDVDFNTAFYTNLLFGLITYGLLFTSAPYIADFYQEPRLIDLIRVTGLSIIINSFQVIQNTILSRKLHFKAQLKATLPATIVSGSIAVLMAYFGYGVWALVVQILISSLLITVFLWMMKLWRPKWVFSFDSLKTIIAFSGYLLISGLSTILFKNMYVVVIAKYFTATLAGYYFFADRIKELLISQLVTSIQTVTYPALSKIQDDPVRLKLGYRKVIAITTFLLFPAITLLAALAEPLFRVLLSEQWLPAVIYLQLMCIVAILNPLHAINLNILKVTGRSDLILYIGLFKKFMMILIFMISYNYGVIGILIGQIISSVLTYIPNSHYSSRLINYSIREQLADFIPTLLLAGAIALFTYSLVIFIDWPAIIEVLAFGTLAIILYLAGAHILKLHAYLLVKELITEKLKKRKQSKNV